jgi:carboxypeptidase T
MSMNRFLRLHRFLGVLFLLGLFLSIPGSRIPAQVAVPLSEPVVVRIEFESLDQARMLAASLDVWEVHPDQGYLIALVYPDQYPQLVASGNAIQIETQLSLHPDTIPDYPCYRTIAELYADLEQVVEEHPDIAALSTIGYSYGGQAIRVLRITNRSIGGEKPKFFLMANIHGREMITPETAFSFIDYLMDNYGSDADVTWVVDYHEIHVVVSTNPDGHVKNEPGQPWAWWRKNTNPSNGCEAGNYGIDLNRNHSFQWGCCGGSSTDPCDETYRGPSATSELETQAVQDYMQTLFPDQRGPGGDDAAPNDATGVMVTLHSYGNLVLWPWGCNGASAPNALGLQALGNKLATYNGYLPTQSFSLYPTDGTTDDWAYGELGIAAFTFEIGSGSGFYPACSHYNALVDPNLSALFYAAKVARTPYLTARGPDVLNLSVTPGQEVEDIMFQLSATIDDSHTGSDLVVAAEYYLGVPPWAGGVGMLMSAADGQFDAAAETVLAQVSISAGGEDQQIIFVRGQDDQGYWGPFSAIFISNQDQPLQQTFFPLMGR